MTVAPWEYWSVAQMLISTHGPDAETIVAIKLDEAEAGDHSGDMIVWREIAHKIAKIRADATPLDPQP